jgi:hypothetical protein
VPSPDLSRYVQILRKLEREPSEAPMTMAAIRSLDRARRSRAAALLAESRERLEAIPALTQPSQPSPGTVIERALSQTEASARRAPASRRPGAHPPPPIAEVLRDVYEEEKKTA